MQGMARRVLAAPWWHSTDSPHDPARGPHPGCHTGHRLHRQQLRVRLIEAADRRWDEPSPRRFQLQVTAPRLAPFLHLRVGLRHRHLIACTSPGYDTAP